MKFAKFVVVEPKSQDSWPIEPGYLRDALEDVVLKIDTTVSIPYFGKKFNFEILYTKPKGKVKITDKTAFVIQKTFVHLCPVCGSKLE